MRVLRSDIDNRVEVVIFDIDGVLADISDRLRVCPGRPGVLNQDWDVYHVLASQDNPIAEYVRLTSILWAGGYRIVLATNRPESNRTITEEWLARHDVSYDRLLMRTDNGNHGHKGWVLDALSSEHIVLALEDDPNHVRMYKEAGIQCAYVHSGYYDGITEAEYYGSGYIPHCVPEEAHEPDESCGSCHFIFEPCPSSTCSL